MEAAARSLLVCMAKERREERAAMDIIESTRGPIEMLLRGCKFIKFVRNELRLS